MKGSKDLLSSVLKTTQMGQIGIRSVLNAPLRASLHTVLKSQLQEYESIEQEAKSIAASRGWELEALPYGVKGMANMMTRTQLSFGNTDSKAAAMMIQGNTRGIIKSLKICISSIIPTSGYLSCVRSYWTANRRIYGKCRSFFRPLQLFSYSAYHTMKSRKEGSFCLRQVTYRSMPIPARRRSHLRMLPSQ